MRKYKYNAEIKYREYLEEPFNTGEAGNENLLVIPQRYDVEIGSPDAEWDWQITYKFSSAVRPNVFNGVTYGASGMTYRRLYEILCKHCNDGNYFIDDYFNTVFQQSYIKKELEAKLKGIREGYKTLDSLIKRRKSDNRYNQSYSRKIAELGEFIDKAVDFVEHDIDKIAEKIKEDIINSVSTGLVTYYPDTLADSTMELRNRAGFPSDPKFYASGNFINNIFLYIRLDKSIVKGMKVNYNNSI